MKLTDSKEETILKDLVKEPVNYFYVERGKNFIEVTNETGTFRISVKEKMPKKSKNRPRGRVPGMEDII